MLSTNHNQNNESQFTNIDNKALKPKNPQRVAIGLNKATNKYILPDFSREDSLNARMFLKYNGAKGFLDAYLPDELNSLYLYYLIKLLGFECKDRELLKAIYSSIEVNDESNDEPNNNTTTTNNNNKNDNNNDTSKETKIKKEIIYTKIDDPLSKRHTIQLIKDLQKAMNKILATRLKLWNFHKIDDFVSMLHRAKNILVLTGAGVSTSLGIPDFRSSEGFYSQIRHLGLDDPQHVFNFEIFKHNPSIFYSIAHMILPPENIYSPLHSFIKLLSDKGKLLRNYTQNIDNLESYAGIPDEKLVQCHGSFATASCISCQWNIPGERIFQNIRNKELPICPYCQNKRVELLANFNGDIENDSTLKSYGVIKPDITFFGEPLPVKFHDCLREDVSKCDLLICIGTSLKVAPVSEIVNMVPAHAPQVLINRDPVKHAEFDISLLGYCDDIAALITRDCGWDIPHKDWPTLKNKKITAVETERGVFNVTSEPQE